VRGLLTLKRSLTQFACSTLQSLSSGFKFGLGMLAAFLTAGLLAVAVTGVMNSFSDGETLTAGKLNTNFQTLKTAIASIETIPPGTIVAFGGTTPPTGWLLCDGTAVNQTTYANLYAAIGCNFGCSGGNFHLPDLRGRFLRGRDGGSGRDPDSGARTAMNTGGNSADNVGSVQGDAFQGHWHDLHLVTNSSTMGGGDNTGSTGIVRTGAVQNAASDGVNGIPRTTSETRPVNASVNFIVKQ
jgi:microcystin-dependent protein